jgi:methionyl-tRNA formyltransferase
MKKIAIFSTDTAHHRFFLNSILKEGVPLVGCIFERGQIKSPFPTYPLFEKEEESFEAENFFTVIPRELPNGLAIEVESINSVDAAERIISLNPDFGVVFGTGRISNDVIQMFPDGLINVHRGITEEYRGLDSDLWAIYHQDYDNLGVTIHKVEPLLDTGDIVYQERVKLKSGFRAHQIRFYTTVIATELVIRALKDYLTGSLQLKPQEKKGRYYSFMPLDLKKIVIRKFNNYCSKLCV